MDENNLQKNLGKAILKNWITFFYSLMIPNAIIPILSGISAVSLSFFVDNSLLSRLMYLLGLLLFSFGSSGVKNNYQKMRNESLLIQKSKSATRNLQSIISHCKKLSTTTNKIYSQNKVSREDFKELGMNVENIAINVNSGIEDWEDIVPELRNKNSIKKKHHKRRILYYNTGEIANFCGYYKKTNKGPYMNDLCSKCPSRRIMES